MRRLFVAGVAQAPKGGIDGVIRHGALARTKGWKEIASTPVERLKLTQYRYSLARERHNVRLPHLHPRSGDTPFRIRQVKLGPLCSAQFVRPGELRAAEWSEFDLANAEWRIPGARMKMGEPHIVPLARQAVAILRELQPFDRGGRYLFPSLRTRERPMSNNTINAALRRLGYASDEQTAHGFRSMASTLLNEQGFPPDVIELQLAHSERNKVRAAYNKAQRLPERRKMMQAWADYLDALRERARIASDLRPVWP